MQNQAQTTRVSAWKSPWVIAWVAGIFIVLGVNIFMAYMAITTSPGLVAKDYYERGQDYERDIFSKRLKDPGWSMKIALPDELVAGNNIPVQFAVLDKAGVPIHPDSVTFYAYRPSDAQRDFSVPMKMLTPGLYTAKAQFRLKGAWDVLVAVKVGKDEFHATRRIFLKAPY